MLLEMEDFGEIPVEVQLNIDSPQMTDDPENTGTPSDIKPSLQAATRKTRRSRRSKLASQKSELVKMECNLCSFETNEGRNALQSHFLDDHSKEDLASTLISITYPDALEDSANESPDSIRSATKRSASLHACPVCQKNIAGKNNLEKHLIRHSSQKPFKCDECKKMFSAKRDLQLHEMRHHSKERPHVCPTCNKGKHLLIHEVYNLKSF
jgi:hypothetical protein